MRANIITLVLFVILYGCGTSQTSSTSYFKTKLIPTKEEIFSYNQFVYPVLANIDSLYNKKVLTIYSTTREKLIIFDFISKEVIDTIPVSFFKNQQLYSYHYHNEDSIFLAFSGAYHPHYWHDSVLLQINRQGDIQKVHSTENLPVISCAKQDLSKDIACMVAFQMGKIHYQDGKLHFLLPRYRYPGDSIFEHYTTPVAGYMSINDNKPHYYPIHFKTPPQIIGKGYMPRRYNHMRWAFNEGGEPLFGFGHTADLYKYDFDKGQMDSFKVETLYTDTLNINLFPDRSYLTENDYASHEYLKIYRDPYRNYYARAFRIPDPTLINSPFDPRYNSQPDPPVTIIFFDNEGHQIGEFLIPEGYSTKILLFDEEGILLHNMKKSRQLKKIILQKFKLEHIPTTKAEFRAEVDKELAQRLAKRKKN